jgi:hypothetical protein
MDHASLKMDLDELFWIYLLFLFSLVGRVLPKQVKDDISVSI